MGAGRLGLGQELQGRGWLVRAETRRRGGERDRGGLYLGELANDPSAIAKNDELWSGAELPFAPRHVIDIEPGDESSRAALGTVTANCPCPDRRTLPLRVGARFSRRRYRPEAAQDRPVARVGGPTGFRTATVAAPSARSASSN